MFATVDFTQGTADSSNVIVIDETTNKELFRIVKRNIRSTGEMHEDHQMEMEHKHGH